MISFQYRCTVLAGHTQFMAPLSAYNGIQYVVAPEFACVGMLNSELRAILSYGHARPHFHTEVTG